MLGTRTLGVTAVLSLAMAGLGGCANEDASGATEASEETEGTTDAADTEDATDTDTGTTGLPEDDPNDVDPLPDGHARVVHSFGNYALAPNEEIQPCIQWTLDNDEPVYVNRVTVTNQGGFHHSNWFVIPEDLFEGEDGFFECDERGFTELEAAIKGTVLFAQSTQSRLDELKLPDGVVVKIPPRHKVVAGGHLLNLAAAEYNTELRMALEIVHPKEVEIVAAPFRLTYFDLDIARMSESRFVGECDLATTYETQAETPLDLKLYYVIPHYHYLGNYFDLTLSGGERDGESVFRLEGFNGDNNGKAFDPPIDFSGATGVQFTCGYNNWRDVDIGWGIGDQEMCVMLGLADSRVLMDAAVQNNRLVGVENGMNINRGTCGVLGLQKNENQGPPTQAEIDGDLYVPPSLPGDADLPPLPPCESTRPEAVAAGPATLSAINDSLFVSSCAYSSCHGGESSVAGLDLTSSDLHRELLEHTVAANTDLPLVDPGNPEGSYLYRLISQCKPTDGAGVEVNHMPLNAPFLSDPGLVAQVRDWIAAGAPAG